METKTLNIISIFVVIILLIVGWFFVFNYGKIDDSNQVNGEITETNLCEQFPNSAECNEDTRKFIESEETNLCEQFPNSAECNEDTGEFIEPEEEDICLMFPNSAICQ